jgi:hypothetical protein
MVDENNILKMIENEYDQVQDLSGSKARNKVAKRVYPALPNENSQLIELFDFQKEKGEKKHVDFSNISSYSDTDISS